ncbi:MAG: tetratricopeptide repeat protein [Candidatus Riflebacteria bacterium]|nr:tetratricopeptide repeat protein [Candidatus Riflebacteria bacterium]
MNNSSEQNLSQEEISEAFEMASSLGRKYSDEGKFELAVKEYKNALKYYPTQIQVMGELCWCLGQIDKPEEMLEWAQKALVIAQKRCSKDNIGRFYFYISQYYKITKQFETACDYLALVILNKPYFLSSYIEMAFCNRMRDNFASALEMYEYVKKTDPEYAEQVGLDDLISNTIADRDCKHREMIHMKLGIEQEKKGEYEKANKSYFTAIERNPKHVMSLFLLFNNEIRLKKDKYEIIAIGENLISLLKESIAPDLYCLEIVSGGLAKCYEIIGNTEKSEEYLKLFNLYKHINVAKKAEEEGELEKAIEEYQTALEIKNDCYIAIDELIDLYFKTNLPDEAMDYAVIGLKLAKEADDNELKAKYLCHIGHRLELSGYDKATEFYEDALNSVSKPSSQLKYCVKIAKFYASKGDTQKSLDYYKKCNDFIKAGAKDTYDIPSNIIRQEIFLDENSDMNHMIKHYNLGAKYYNEMNFEEAANEMQTALSYIPQDLDTMDILNRCLYKLKRFDECYDVAYAGYMISNRDHDYRFIDMFCYNLGNILYNTEHYEEALKYYHCASYHKPEDTDYLYFIAASYRNLGDYDKACMYFNKVADLDPNDQSAKEQFVYCYDKLHEGQ